MVSNSVAVQTGYDPSQATATFYWGQEKDGRPGPFFPDLPGVRYWPGHGVRLGERLLIFLMGVHPSDEGLGFEVKDWAAVLVANPDDEPSRWRMDWIDTPRNPIQIIVGSASVLTRDGFLYAYGAREPGPEHSIYLARWSMAAAAEGDLSGMEWWAGEERGWVADGVGPSAAVPVFSDAQTELTVHYDTASDTFMEFQTWGFGASVIVRRTAPDLTGPWSAPDTVHVPQQIHFPDIMIYQGKAHAHLEGADLVITYCTNSFDFGDHLAEPWLYFPRIVRLTRDVGK